MQNVNEKKISKLVNTGNTYDKKTDGFFHTCRVKYGAFATSGLFAYLKLCSGYCHAELQQTFSQKFNSLVTAAVSQTQMHLEILPALISVIS